jgi:tRNA A22 N-methylase
MKPPDPVLCPVHPDEKLKYWCSDHQIAICRDCLLFEHNGDKYALIDKMAQDVSTQVSALSLVVIWDIFDCLVRKKTSNNTIIIESTFGRDKTTDKTH